MEDHQVSMIPPCMLITWILICEYNPLTRRHGIGGFKPERIALLSKTLDALKVPHHRAPGEAEAECAKLQQEGIVDAVWSEDGDTLILYACSQPRFIWITS